MFMIPKLHSIIFKAAITIHSQAYCDTQSGTHLSTNMFAYCENNVVMNMDNKGYSIGISSGWVSFGIDLIIDVFAAPVALAYHAIKIAVKTYLKKYGVKKLQSI